LDRPVDKRRLAIHHLCATDVGAAELGDIAARLNVPDISIFVRPPTKNLDIFPTVRTLEEAKSLRRQLQDAGTSVHNVEAFSIGPKTDVSSFEPDFEKSALLGARRATTHIHDTDENRALERFSTLCSLAQNYDIAIGLEFMVFSTLAGFDRTVRFVERSRMQNASLVVDALHLHRTGGSPELINPDNSRYLGSLQICDAHLEAPREPFKEAIESRMIPGEGELPLNRLLKAISTEIQVDFEVPLGALRAKGVSAFERIRRVVEAGRKLVNG
jgi:sugar phosphate isomerase/epimerase